MHFYVKWLSQRKFGLVIKLYLDVQVILAVRMFPVGPFLLSAVLPTVLYYFKARSFQYSLHVTMASNLGSAVNIEASCLKV